MNKIKALCYNVVYTSRLRTTHSHVHLSEGDWYEFDVENKEYIIRGSSANGFIFFKENVPEVERFDIFFKEISDIRNKKLTELGI